jgi:hypothetical protein
MRRFLAGLAALLGLSGFAHADVVPSVGIEYGQPVGFAAEGRLTTLNDQALAFEAGLHLGTKGGKVTLGAAHWNNHLGVVSLRLAGVRTWNRDTAGRTYVGLELGYSLLYFISADVGLLIPGGAGSKGAVFSWTIGIGLPLIHFGAVPGMH